MTKYKCDLHVHSCLSPCGDDDMTPANIAGMATINSLGVVALTDHNTSKNCPAFFAQAKAHGIIPIAGMELTTAEDIHVVCLFPTLESAMEFDSFVAEKRMRFPNKPDIFGHQYIIDENDQIIGEESDLLINATSLSLEEAFEEVAARGGVSYPAHIDRASNGIISMLGTFPDEPKYTAFELHSAEALSEYTEKYPIIKNLARTVSSDAHYLWDISDNGYEIEIDDEPYSSALVRQRIIDYLLGK